MLPDLGQYTSLCISCHIKFFILNIYTQIMNALNHLTWKSSWKQSVLNLYMWYCMGGNELQSDRSCHIQCSCNPLRPPPPPPPNSYKLLYRYAINPFPLNNISSKKRICLPNVRMINFTTHLYQVDEENLGVVAYLPSTRGSVNIPQESIMDLDTFFCKLSSIITYVIRQDPH